MRRILVPTDLSELSENALQLAVSIAPKMDAKIYLINFIDHPFGTTFSTMGDTKTHLSEEERFTIELIKKNEQRLGALNDKYDNGSIIKFQVYDEDFDEGVEKYVKEENIDLIIMGTTGEETAKESFTGNHTERVIKTATCPVISLKEKYHATTIDHLVVGIDTEHDSEDNYKKAADMVNTVATKLGAQLHLVHITGSSDIAEREEKVNSFVSKHGYGAHTMKVVRHDSDEKGLIAYANEFSNPMVVSLTHTEKNFFDVFQTSMAEELSKHATIPVMAINLHNI